MHARMFVYVYVCVFSARLERKLAFGATHANKTSVQNKRETESFSSERKA